MYFALGYVHASERLWQMDLLRRAGGGTLSELFGERTRLNDRYLRTLGIEQTAQASAKAYFGATSPGPWQKGTLAYLAGVNTYIAKGANTPEHSLLGVEVTPFTVEDVYRAVGYMSYSFAVAPRTDPVVEMIRR